MRSAIPMMALLFAGSLTCEADSVFADDFDYVDGISLSGQNPAVGGTWSGGGGWKTDGGAVYLSAGSDSVFGNFTAALSAGQKLTLTFETRAVTGFLGSSWAVVSLFDVDGYERCYIGDPGGPNTTWGLGGYIATVATGDSNQANVAVFTYEYDTGAWTFSTGGGTYQGTGTAGYALSRIRIASGGTSDDPAGNMKIDRISATIEQLGPANLKVTAFTRISPDAFKIFWSGGDGTNDIEESTDLENWMPILTDVSSPQVIPVDTEDQPKRFFRVVEPATP